MKETGYNLGLVSVSFRRHTPSEILAATREAGLSVIEWGSDIHAPCTDLDNLRRLAALQREYGIVCSSYGTYFRLGETPMEELEDYIRAAELLGTDILRLWCGKASGADMTAGERDALFADCRRAAEIAEANGVTLCLECHKGTFTEDPRDAVLLMESIRSPRFRMYWQPFQWQNTEQNLKNAQMIAPYATHLHVFHWKGDERFPLAEGIAEWREYLTAFPRPQTLLLEFMPDDQLTSLAGEADALRAVVRV